MSLLKKMQRNFQEIGLLFLVGICVGSCQHENISIVTQKNDNTPIMPSDTYTAIPTPMLTDTHTITNTFTTAFTATIPALKLESLPPAPYIGVLQAQYYGNPEGNIIVLSTEGINLGNWISVRDGILAHPSRDLAYLAYIEKGDLRILETDTLQNLETMIEEEDCPGIRITEYAAIDYSWDNNGEKIAVGCGLWIGIYDIREMAIIDKIHSPIEASPNPNQPVFINNPISPKWSPDGKWIAYMVEREHPFQPGVWYFGPFLSGVECVMGGPCTSDSVLNIDFTELTWPGALAWTSDNQIAYAPSFSNNILIYEIYTQKLIDKILLPENADWDIEAMEFSSNGEWLAIQNDGLYLYNIHTGGVSKVLESSVFSFFWMEIE